MKDIFKTPLFKLSAISSILLFLSVMYGQKFWSELWLIYGYIEMGFIAFFITILIASVIFGFRNKRKYSYSFIPFGVNFIALVLVIVLPLNWIRNRIGFTVYHNKYEKAYKMVRETSSDSAFSLYKLPPEYESLSVGGGEVFVVNKQSSKAVLFLTFRGAPSGAMGFVRVDDGKDINYFTGNLLIQVYGIKNLGNNWYYVTGK